MMTVTPERGLVQRLDALEMANEIRYARAEFKRDLRRLGAKPAAYMAAWLVEAPPRWAQTMKVRNLLVALPLIGDAKADRVLVQLRINPRKTIGGMSDRQRQELAHWLNQRACQ